MWTTHDPRRNQRLDMVGLRLAYRHYFSGNRVFWESGLRGCRIQHTIYPIPGAEPQPGVLPGGGRGWNYEFAQTINAAPQTGIGVMIPVGTKQLIARYDVGAFAGRTHKDAWRFGGLIYNQLSVGIGLGNH